MRTILSACVLILLVGSSGLNAETLLYANGISNGYAARHDNLAALVFEFDDLFYDDESTVIQHVPGVDVGLLVNPTHQAADIWEAVVQLTTWSPDDRALLFELYHKGTIAPEIYERWEPFLYDPLAGQTAQDLFNVLRNLQLAAAAGPTVVVGHSQGTLFTEQAFQLMDPTLSHRVSLVYVGSPWSSTLSAPTVVSADCDPLAFLNPEIETTFGLLPGCHAFKGYVTGKYSYQSKKEIFSAVLDGLSLTESEDPKVEHLEFGFNRNGRLEIVAQVACENGWMVGNAPILQPRFDPAAPWALEKLFIVLNGESIDMVPLAMWIDTCRSVGLPHNISQPTYSWGEPGDLSLRQVDARPRLRTASCRPDVDYSLGELQFVVKDIADEDAPGGLGRPLCQGVVDFVRQ